MPLAPNRPCIVPGCPRYQADRGNCREHLREARQQRAQDSGDAFYSCRRWLSFRRWFLAGHPVCEGYPVGTCQQPANEVDHIKSRRERPDLAFVEENCRALCKPCHSRRTASEQSGWR